jgi:uncharacterized protein YoxC
MRTILFLAVLALIASGCSTRTDELEKQNAALENSNKQLSADVAVREEYVNHLTEAINDVYASVEEARAKERSILKESSSMENGIASERAHDKADMIERLGEIRTVLRDNRAKLDKLQAKLASSARQYAGLQKMVASLKATIEERDKSIAELTTRVEGLQHDVAQKTEVINQKDSVIDTQYRQITTTYYITGTRHELEEKGIIKKEGGFLWGLLGSTTILANGFDERLFRPMNKEVNMAIQVKGKIDQILPQRGPQTYSAEKISEEQSLLTIAQPADFWKDKYLVIITDTEGSMN